VGGYIFPTFLFVVHSRLSRLYFGIYRIVPKYGGPQLMAALRRLLALASRFQKLESGSRPSCYVLIFPLGRFSPRPPCWPCGCVLLVGQIMCPQPEVLSPCPRQVTGSVVPHLVFRLRLLQNQISPMTICRPSSAPQSSGLSVAALCEQMLYTVSRIQGGWRHRGGSFRTDAAARFSLSYYS
jgi:hypothetical protein